MTKILGLFEIPQVLVVCNYCYRMFHTSEVVTPFLQGLDDSKELSIVDGIVLFGRRKGGRMVSTGVKVSVGVFLHEYPSGGSEGGVSHNKEWLGCIQHFDHWC